MPVYPSEIAQKNPDIIHPDKKYRLGNTTYANRA